MGDKAGNLTFYHVDQGTDSEWGFTALKSKCRARRSKECRPENVPVIRLSDWIDEHIYMRQLPEMVHGHYENGPQVGKLLMMIAVS